MNTLESMIEYTLSQAYWIEYVRRQQNFGNIQEMTLGYFHSNISWKLEHGEHDGKEQSTKQMNGQCGDGWMRR